MNEKSEIQKPSIGRVVLVHRLDGEPMGNGQKHAPALVQTAWSDSDALMVNAVAFPDCAAPANLTSIPHESKTTPGSTWGHAWSWPPRV